MNDHSLIGICAALIVMISAVSVSAQSWENLDDVGIKAALTDKTLAYETGWQQFFASGRTLYNSGHDSWGYWEARGNRYCSQWPPADGWACYDVVQSGDVIQFIGDSGDSTEGRYK